MARMQPPSLPDIKARYYDNFRGVDFSVDPSMVDRSRSPWAPNMISDDGGNPVKRPGWRVLEQFEGSINGLFHARMGSTDHIVVHAGTKLYDVVDGSVTEIQSGLLDARSIAWNANSTIHNEEAIFDSVEQTGVYPKTFEASAGSIYVEMGGGKGCGIRFKDFTQKPAKEIYHSGSPGGKIAFYLDLKDRANIRIEKIMNGSEIFRASFHVYVNDILYAAVGGAGDCGGGDMQGVNLYYLNAKGGGLGGKDPGGNGSNEDGNKAKGGNGPNGGEGQHKGAIDTNRTTYYPGEDGKSYPDSRGGGFFAGTEYGAASQGAGGCGYGGGGAGGVHEYETSTVYRWENGSGAGGSSFVKEDDENLTLIENSQGTNDGGAYIKVLKKENPNSPWNDALYIITGREFLVFDGEEVKDAIENAYVPTVMTGRAPTGGGITGEQLNLITPKRTDSFLGDSTSKNYQLTTADLDNEEVKVEVSNGTGGWDVLKEGSGSEGFIVNRNIGMVTLGKAYAPVVAGKDNVKITYSKTIGRYASRIKRCTMCTLYGLGGDNRVFLTGNPEYKAYDWWSDIDKSTYFPEYNYAVTGSPTKAVMGYQRVGEYLVLIKEEGKQEATIFFRNGIMNGAGTDAIFPTRPEIAGIGALSKHCFAALGDEPLFLSHRGVCAITSNLLSNERVLRNRSYFLDHKLMAEQGLRNAIACEWDGYYLLSINGNVYILDGRHKAGDVKGNSDFLYEAYYWTNIPAICLLSIGKELYFGTQDGRLCKFNTDIGNMTRYSDGGMLGEDGRITEGGAIDAAWFTPNEDDGCVQLFKTLQKKGCLVTICPYDRSSGEVCFVVDGNPEEFIKHENMDIFDWENIDFERFSFNSNTSPQEIYFNKKRKKYKRLQIGIRNRQLNEGFGILQIVKSFVIGNYSKNRGI